MKEKLRPVVVQGHGSRFFLSHIEGLRGLAVIMVLGFHFHAPGFSGGFLGVDGFFVISGYLITSLILENLRDGRFSYTDFLARRTRRLAPALILVTTLTTTAAYVLFTPSQVERFGESLVGVSTYASNFVFLMDDSYFEVPTAFTPLLHTWSLSVEWQFYLIFPALLAVVARRRLSFVVAVLAALGISSFVLWSIPNLVVRFASYSDLAFYLFPTRAWELMIGALIAVFLGRKNLVSLDSESTFSRTFMSFVGFLFIGAGIAISDFSSGVVLPTLAVILGFSALILFARLNAFGRALSSAPMVWLGKRSYSIYLWHFPLLAFVKVQLGEDDLSAGLVLLVLTTTVFLGAITTWLIETPFRNSKIGSRQTLALGAAFAGIGITVGLVSIAIPNNVQEEEIAAKALSEASWIEWSPGNERFFNLAYLDYLAGEQVDTLVLGSSRSMQIDDAMLTGTIANLSVSGASLEDIIALGVLGIQTLDNDRLLLGLDPWVINKNNGQVRYRTIIDDVDFAYSVLQGQAPRNYRPVEQQQASETLPKPLFSRFYMSINRSFQRLEALDGNPSLIQKKAKDGSLVYDIQYLQKTEDQKLSELYQWLPYSNMDKFVLDKIALGDLETFVTWAEDQGVEVVFFLPPYHPALAAELATSSNGAEIAEARFRELAVKYNLQVLGSYDSSASGCDQSEFLDLLHPAKSCLEAVLIGERNLLAPDIADLEE